MVASPGMVRGWSGVGAGKDCAGPTGGVKVSPPMRVVVVAWNPVESWNALARDVIASSDSDPSWPWARTTFAIECVECDATIPRCELVQTWVLIPVAVPRPGNVASATLLVRER